MHRLSAKLAPKLCAKPTGIIANSLFRSQNIFGLHLVLEPKHQPAAIANFRYIGDGRAIERGRNIGTSPATRDQHRSSHFPPRWNDQTNLIETGTNA
jgi:hypothetical protein